MKRLLIILSLFVALLVPIALRQMLLLKPSLYIYMWSDYIKPSLIKKFEKKHDCLVIVDTYDSNESLFTKLQLGGAGYDIIFPSNYYLNTMAEKNLLMPIERSKIPNLRHVDNNLLRRFSISDTQWGIPYMVSFSGIAWRTDRLASPPTSWSLFGNPGLKGRMTMLNDPRETLGVALRFLGFSANSANPDEISKARDLIMTWKPNLAKLESEQYKNGIASAEYLAAHAYNGDTLQLTQDSPHVGFSYPDEGSLVSFDYAAILRTCSNPDLSHAFIDFLHDPEIAAENTSFTMYRCVNTTSRKYLPNHLQNSNILYPEENPETTFECIQPVGSARREYLLAWDAIKSG